MNFKICAKLNSWILLVESFFMIPSIFITIVDRDYHVLACFLLTIAICLLFSLILKVLSRNNDGTFTARDGLISVSICWLTLSVFGCLPFFISGTIPNFVDALFEMVSGFTTTGASILKDVECLSRGLIYWRSFSHWLGGMGVLVFILAILPMNSSSGSTLHILRAESPGPNVSKIVPKIKQTTKILYLIYCFLTVLDIVFLLLGKMSFFDAVCTALGTAGTGGFGIKNDSLGSYSLYIQMVTAVFMLLFGINFTCYYLLILKKFKEVLKDEELRLYVVIVALSVILITINITSMFSSIGEAFSHAFFQVASIITTTGYSTVDFDLWPSLSKTIILALMITGGCAGSTCGGIKLSRIILLFKGLKRNIDLTTHPNTIKSVLINGSKIDEKIIDNTYSYLVAYSIIIVLSTLLISVDGLTITTNISAVLSCFNNIGPGLELVGPTANYSVFSDFSKLILTFNMLLGRLEIYPLLALLIGSKE